jgi:hypothetical protein
VTALRDEPKLWTMSQMFREVSKALNRMTFAEKAAFRFEVLMKYPETRRRLLN